MHDAEPALELSPLLAESLPVLGEEDPAPQMALHLEGFPLDLESLEATAPAAWRAVCEALQRSRFALVEQPCVELAWSGALPDGSARLSAGAWSGRVDQAGRAARRRALCAARPAEAAPGSGQLQVSSLVLERALASALPPLQPRANGGTAQLAAFGAHLTPRAELTLQLEYELLPEATVLDTQVVLELVPDGGGLQARLARGAGAEAEPTLDLGPLRALLEGLASRRLSLGAGPSLALRFGPPAFTGSFAGMFGAGTLRLPFTWCREGPGPG